jgi:site-specific DNA-methyltransferase (adenine-specific)
MSTQNYQNQIVEGNCLDIMLLFDDNSIDMVLTSPPYDNLRVYKGYQFPFEAIAKQLYRITKPGGVIVWIVADATINGSETGTSFKHALGFKEIGFNIHDTMIFKKKNPIPQIYRQRYNNEFEYMFIFSKGQVKTHNPIMVPCLHANLELNGTTYKNYSKSQQKREKIANPVKSEKIKGNVWDYVVGKNLADQAAKDHPAPFPYELAKDHMEMVRGDLLQLDPQNFFLQHNPKHCLLFSHF